MTDATTNPAAPKRRRRRRTRLLTATEASDAIVAQRTSLLQSAHSHGPFCWTAADVRNGLHWFAPETDRIVSEARCGDGASQELQGGASTALQLLKALLHHPTITEPRPATPDPSTGKKRRRDQVHHDNEHNGNNQKDRTELRQPPIREIMLGYAAVSAASATDGKDESAAALDGIRENQTKINSASKSSLLTKFKHDLREIVCARATSRELGVQCELASGYVHTSAPSDADLSGLSLNDLRLAVLDESDRYFHSTSTCVAIAYASKIYDRLEELHGAADETNDSSLRGMEADAGTSSMGELLEKLGMLAKHERQILEVYGLIMLEPARRAHQESGKGSHMKGLLDMDQICSSDLCQELCRNFEESAQSADASACDVWTLASPLLCSLSHAYFPIALAYVQYLLKTMVELHLRQPQLMADRIVLSITDGQILRSSGPETGEAAAADVADVAAGAAGAATSTTYSKGQADDIVFCRNRLLALYGTSDRLCLLVRDEVDGYDTMGHNQESSGSAEEILETIRNEVCID